jgi:hypothetical protein
MAAHVWLMADTGSMADSIDLLDTDAYDIRDGTLSVLDKPGQVSFALRITEVDQRGLDRRIQELFDLLNLAAQGRTRLRLGLLLDGSDQILFADVVEGSLTLPPNVLTAAAFIAHVYRAVPLTFSCLPYLRAEPYTLALTATLTNGVDSLLYIANIPGTAPALLRVEVVDVSTGMALNYVRVGVWSDRYLTQASDMPLLINATAGPDGTASAAAQPDTNGGVYIRTTTSGSAKHLADVAVANRGTFGVLARVRDSATATSATMKITSLVRDFSTGSLPQDPYTYVVVAKDATGGTGKVLAITPAVPVRLIKEGSSGTGRVILTWPVVPHVADHDVYWKRGSNAYLHLATGSALGTYTHATEAGGIAGNPPKTADATVANALVRATTRLPAGATIREYPWVSCRLSNDTWEPLLLMVDTLPPQGRGESSLSAASIVGIEAISSGTNTPTLDVDSVLLIPFDDGQYAEAWYRTDDLATQRTWVFDPDRSGGQRAYLTDGSGTLIGPLDATPDALTAGPGPAIIAVAAQKAGGIWPITNCQVQLRVTVFPRYLGLGGLP